jgi:hypothetical protein
MTSKKKIRKELLELLNRDYDWYKKETELTHKIQNKAKELINLDKQSRMGLNIENYRELCDSGKSCTEMAKIFGLSSQMFYLWRKKYGFCDKVEE